MIIAQLFLDFCESLSSQIITISGLNEVDITFNKSFKKFSEESMDNKKALHEILEEDARVNPKKILFQVIFKVLSFLRVFKDCENEDILIDRILVALMHKKINVMEQCFIGRSMRAPASSEDKEIELLSKIFKSILSHEDFIEFSASPLKRKKPILKNMYSAAPGKGLTTPSVMTQNEKRVKNLVYYISKLAPEDQKFFLTKVDSIAEEAKDHVYSASNSPMLPMITEKRQIQEARNVGDEDFGKLIKFLMSYRHKNKNAERRRRK